MYVQTTDQYIYLLYVSQVTHMAKLVTATRHGGSITVPITNLAQEGDQFYVEAKGNDIVLKPLTKHTKSIGVTRNGG